MEERDREFMLKECYEAILGRSFWTGSFYFQGMRYRYDGIASQDLAYQRACKWTVIERSRNLSEKDCANFIVDYHDKWQLKP